MSALRVLKTLKILSRKYDNRVRLGESVVPDLVRVLSEERSAAVAGEAEAKPALGPSQDAAQHTLAGHSQDAKQPEEAMPLSVAAVVDGGDLEVDLAVLEEDLQMDMEV